METGDGRVYKNEYSAAEKQDLVANWEQSGQMIGFSEIAVLLISNENLFAW